MGFPKQALFCDFQKSDLKHNAVKLEKPWIFALHEIVTINFGGGFWTGIFEVNFAA